MPGDYSMLIRGMCIISMLEPGVLPFLLRIRNGTVCTTDRVYYRFSILLTKVFSSTVQQKLENVTLRLKCARGQSLQ